MYYCRGQLDGSCCNRITTKGIKEQLGNTVISKICALDPGHEIHNKIEKIWVGDGSDLVGDDESHRDKVRLTELEARMNDLVEDRFLRGRFDGMEEMFEDLRAKLQNMIDDQRLKVESSRPTQARGTHMELLDSEIVREAWESAQPIDQNSIVKVVLQKVVVQPPPPGIHQYEPDRVEFHWIAA